MPDYSKGKIYKIECNITGEVYYGSTTQYYLTNRISAHTTAKICHCVSRSIINRGDFNYKIVEYYPCNSKQELETRERWWIENNMCINKVIPTRTDKEYREDNKDKIAVKGRKWYEENRDKVLKRQHEYTINNKEIIKSKQNEKFSCECGGIYTRSNYSRHIKSKKHQDFISHHTDTP